jgi:hypothetical protein
MQKIIRSRGVARSASILGALGLLAALVVSPATLQADPGDPGERIYTAADLFGPYGFEYDGSVASPTGFVPLAAAGRYVADGKETLSGKRTLGLGGATLSQSFTCSYTVNTDGTGHTHCNKMDFSPPSPADEDFDFTFVDGTVGTVFVVTSPNVVAAGRTTRQ